MLSRIKNIGKIVTWSPDEGKLASLENQEILIEAGIIKEIGESVSGARVEFDADGALITPGFIDSHTHPIFFGNRGNEFGLRVAGKSYEDISRRVPDVSKAKQLLNWEASTQLREGVTRTINWIKTHPWWLK